MDAVFPRREAEAGTESDDLLLQQEDAKERQEVARGHAPEGPEGRREQAHGPALPQEGVEFIQPPRDSRAAPPPFRKPLPFSNDSRFLGGESGSGWAIDLLGLLHRDGEPQAAPSLEEPRLAEAGLP